MKLSELKRALLDAGLIEYHPNCAMIEYNFESSIFEDRNPPAIVKDMHKTYEKGYSTLVMIDRPGHFTSRGYEETEITEDEAHVRFYILDKDRINNYIMCYFCGQVKFQDKKLSEISPEWLKKFLDCTVTAIRSLEEYEKFCEESENEYQRN